MREEAFELDKPILFLAITGQIAVGILLWMWILFWTADGLSDPTSFGGGLVRMLLTLAVLGFGAPVCQGLSDRRLDLSLTCALSSAFVALPLAVIEIGVLEPLIERLGWSGFVIYANGNWPAMVTLVALMVGAVSALLRITDEPSFKQGVSSVITTANLSVGCLMGGSAWLVFDYASWLDDRPEVSIWPGLVLIGLALVFSIGSELRRLGRLVLARQQARTHPQARICTGQSH